MTWCEALLFIQSYVFYAYLCQYQKDSSKTGLYCHDQNYRDLRYQLESLQKIWSFERNLDRPKMQESMFLPFCFNLVYSLTNDRVLPSQEQWKWKFTETHVQRKWSILLEVSKEAEFSKSSFREDFLATSRAVWKQAYRCAFQGIFRGMFSEGSEVFQ